MKYILSAFLALSFYTGSASANQSVVEEPDISEASDFVLSDAESENYNEEWDSIRPRPRPRPGYGGYQCVARDAGWEEHWGGHVSYARDYNTAYYRAQNECRRMHGRCYVSCYRAQ